MPTVAANKKQPAKRGYPFTKHFKEWLAVRSQGRTLKARENLLREGEDRDGGLKGAVIEFGEQDEKGHYYVDLRQPVEFQDEKGNVIIYTGLKAQRSLSPSQPTPDPELTEELLKKKGLWLSDVQLEQIRQIQMLNPYVEIRVEVDTEAVAAAYLKDVLTSKEYNALLMEQVENFSFIPLVEK